ncbi:MAG: polyphosphate polymerase domain-containing protein [Blautia sp.]|nr:polyphosphate polymerase domain-containing protein [Blautia sp.]
MNENFARVETKYMLCTDQMPEIEDALEAHGFHRMDFGNSLIQSLYYDTPDYLLIRQSLERPGFKEKLRLRVYGEASSLSSAFLEMKRKYKGVVYKRRTMLPLRTAMNMPDTLEMPETAGQIGKEIIWMMKRYRPVPAVVIRCDREQWVHSDDPGFRITFDRNIRFRNRNFDLRAKEYHIPLTDAGQRLMEIKTGSAMPQWLARVLWETGARHVHYSKYGLAYQRIIQDQRSIERGERACSTVSLPMGA